jgi:hypothetical protein
LRKSPPGKAGFCSFMALSSGFPPALDQLQQHLIAAPQSVAFLNLVQIGNRFPRKRHDKLMLAVGDQIPAVGPHTFSFERGGPLDHAFAFQRGN